MSSAGVSFVGGVNSSHSASAAITACTASRCHLLVVSDYSRTKDTPNGKCIKSRPFSVGGYRWLIEYYPNGISSEYSDSISLFLVLDEVIAEPVKVHFEFSFIDQIEKRKSSHTHAWTCDFIRQNRKWGFGGFVEREALERSKHLKDDCFTIRCDIIDAGPAAVFIEVPPSDICQHLSHLLQTKVGTDVAFEVGDETFAAHRCVLAARSTVFKAMLFGPMEEGRTVSAIHISDMETQVFRALLKFIYTDSLPKAEIGAMGEEESEGDEGEVKQVTWHQQLLVAADRYDLQRLKLMCEEKLYEHMNVRTVATILATAEQHHRRWLKEACLDFLKSPANLQQVLAADGLDHITRTCPYVLIELLSKFAS